MLCTMKELLEDAEKQNRAVGAFSVYSMEMLKGIVQAAEEMKTPVILQIAESRFPYAPFELMAPAMRKAAELSGVKMAVHLDHGLHLETIQKALDYGFTSVMLDASSHPLEENIQMTKQVLAMAKSYGASVETEIGCVGGNEGMGDIKDNYTHPEDVTALLQAAEVDALAIAIGNAHGNYKKAPNLQFSLLEQIHAEHPVPLVLHGGSGISFADFRKAVDRGIRKINIATANLNALTEAAAECLGESGTASYFQISERMTQKVCECTKTHIYVFNNQGEL